MRARASRRVVLVLAVVSLVGALAAPPAPALDVGPLQVDIIVNTDNWSACGIVRDDLTNARYTAVLTATGFQSRGTSQNGVILGQARHDGNPAQPCTPPGFISTISAVEYTLEWTSVLGTTGSLTKTCVETNLVAAVAPLPVTVHQDIISVDRDETAMSLTCTVT